MTAPAVPRGRTGRAAAWLACLALAGCGVSGQDGPEGVPGGEIPPELATSAGPTARPPTAARVPVYLVERDRLVRLEQPAARRSVEEALLSLLTSADAGGSRRSAVPAGTSVERLQVRGDVLTVGLSEDFLEVRGRDQVLAVAQVVWTATEFPPLRRVAVQVRGQSIDLPVGRGAVSDGPAGREDYRSVGPLG